MKIKDEDITMEIQKISTTNSVGKTNEVEASKSPDNVEVFQNYNDIEDTNRRMSEWTKDRVRNNLSAMKDRIELRQPWLGADYIKFTGDGKMTYGELREWFGIPPRVLSNNNKGNFKDTDVIEGTIKIPLDGIGFYERRMSEMEAQLVQYERAHGDAASGWEKALPNKDIISILK